MLIFLAKDCQILPGKYLTTFASQGNMCNRQPVVPLNPHAKIIYKYMISDKTLMNMQQHHNEYSANHHTAECFSTSS